MSIGIVLMGLLVGLLVGMTGVGAASLLTPFLVLIGIHPTVAVGTDLFYNSVTKIFGTMQHWRQKTVNWKLVRNLAFGSLPSAAGAVLLLHLSQRFFHNEDTIIKHGLGYILIVVAIVTLLRLLFEKKLRPNKWQAKPLEQKRFITALIGVVFGFVVGLTSVGSGSLFAVAMIYLYKLGGAELVGTDIAHALLVVSVSGALHMVYGHVDYMLAANLLIGSIPGVLVGSRLSVKVPSKPIRIVMSVLIFLSGLKLV